MPFPIGAEVVVSISDPLARDHVHLALRRDHAPFRDVSRWNLASALHGDRPTAMVVYDLAPGNSRVIEELEKVRRKDPALPVVLYPPPAPSMAQLIADSGRLGLVHAVLQGKTRDHLELLGKVLRRASTQAPAAQALRAIEGFIVYVRPTMARFLAEVTRRVGPLEQRPPTVATVARAIAISPRALERVWTGTGLPSPKQMIDWVTLIVLTCCAASAKQDVATLARRRGIDARQLHRLRRRVKPWRVSDSRIDAEDEFTGLLLAFGTRCRERRLHRAGRLGRMEAYSDDG